MARIDDDMFGYYDPYEDDTNITDGPHIDWNKEKLRTVWFVVVVILVIVGAAFYARHYA